MILGTDRGPIAFRRATWTVLAGAYFLVFFKIIDYWSGPREALLWSLAAGPPLAFACFAVFRKGHRALVTLCASALVAATLCALQLAQADWGHQPEAPVLAARLLAPIGLCFVALLALMKAAPPQRHFETITRGAALPAAFLIAWAGFWFIHHSEASITGLFAGDSSHAVASRPNVLLIVLDTVRADHLDLFGYERQTMPNLKRFALEEAQVVTRTVTSGSWTLPTHASLFTGLYPSAHGAHYPFLHEPAPEFLAYSMREDVPTLAEFLASAGYQTAGIVANFGMLSKFGIPRGFEHYAVNPGAAYFATRTLWLYRVSAGNLPSPGNLLRTFLPAGLQTRSRMFSVREPAYRRAWEINALTRQWLNRYGNRPFFLFVNYLDAHDPFLPIPEDDERFVKRPPDKQWFGFPRERYFAALRGAEKFSAEEIEFMKGQYDAELVSLDRELGRLLDHLKETGLFENTLIFITTDHGEAFYEHGFPSHGNSVYQPEIDGFVVARAPTSLGPIHASAQIQAVDFFPTVAWALNEPFPEHIQGSPWGNGRDYALSEVFCRSCGSEPASAFKWPDSLRHEVIAVVIGRHKLIRSTRGPDEVYDLSADPMETKPIDDPDPEFLRRAEEIIAERNERLVESLSVNPEDRELLEKLRSLGYVQ
jgi:arylsulfatase A-like enzyme